MSSRSLIISLANKLDDFAVEPLWNIFFSSVIISFSSVTSVWYFLILLLWLLKFSPVSSFQLPSSVSIFMTITLNSLSGKLLIFISLRFFPLRFCFVLSFGMCASVPSFCLTLFVCCYVLDETATSSNLKEVFLYRR